MNRFQLTVNGEQHMISQEDFKAALIDCPKEVAQKQIELGYGVTAVTNVYNNVLVPIATDVHKFIFVRTPTQAMKAAEIEVLLGNKVKDPDVFLTTEEDKDAEIIRLRAELESFSSKEVPEATKEEKVPESGNLVPPLSEEDILPDDVNEGESPDTKLPNIKEEDNGYTLDDLKDLGPAGIINLICEEDENQDPDLLKDKNINELVEIFEEIVSDKELEEIKSIK